MAAALRRQADQPGWLQAACELGSACSMDGPNAVPPPSWHCASLSRPHGVGVVAGHVRAHQANATLDACSKLTHMLRHFSLHGKLCAAAARPVCDIQASDPQTLSRLASDLKHAMRTGGLQSSAGVLCGALAAYMFGKHAQAV